jgi:hypothetical protein
MSSTCTGSEIPGHAVCYAIRRPFETFLFQEGGDLSAVSTLRDNVCPDGIQPGSSVILPHWRLHS